MSSLYLESRLYSISKFIIKLNSNSFQEPNLILTKLLPSCAVLNSQWTYAWLCCAQYSLPPGIMLFIFLAPLAANLLSVKCEICSVLYIIPLVSSTLSLPRCCPSHRPNLIFPPPFRYAHADNLVLTHSVVSATFPSLWTLSCVMFLVAFRRTASEYHIVFLLVGQ